MNILLREMPGRCFDVGIAEGHAVTFRPDWPRQAMIPFCNIYSTFMQRAYDNVIHDVAIQELPVVMCLDRGGLVGEVSAAHYDLRFARPLDEELLDEVGRRFERVVTVEDGVVRGGVGSAVRDFFDRRGYRTQVRSLGIPDDRFVEHGTPAELYAQCGFDEEGILRAILER